MKDYAITVDDDGEMVAHRADCLHVRKLADQGEPVMTLLGCERPMAPDMRRHSCLTISHET